MVMKRFWRAISFIWCIAWIILFIGVQLNSAVRPSLGIIAIYAIGAAAPYLIGKLIAIVVRYSLRGSIRY
jgi:hypothetical protein